jgi:nitroreductase
VELDEVLRRRRMVRNFRDAPVARDDLDRILDAGRRGASAGNTQGTTFVVLVGAEQTARYWAATLPVERRATFAWPGLLLAPVLIIPCVSASAYVERYGEADKVQTGLGESADAWPVPYWHVDGGMSVMAMLLAAVDRDLGALFFGIFEHEPAVRDALAIPDTHQPIGTLAIGHPAPDEAGRSSSRPKRDAADVIRLGSW